MTIQRQYSLPNCQLLIEGLSQDGADGSGRPPISVVTHVECRVAGHDRPLIGGKELLESLVKAVSAYAQEYLSGVPHLATHSKHRGTPKLVQLQRIDTNLHRLMVQPQIDNPIGKDKARLHQMPSTPATQLDLTTVQLFDMVEAVDQFFADAQTLPELSLNLTPLSKRFAAAQEPIAKRALPAALGLSSLTVAAIALFYVPNPPNRRPQPIAANPALTNPLASATPNPTITPVASPSSTVAVSPSARSVSPASIVAASPLLSPSVSPAAANSTAIASPSGSQEIDGILSTAPEITDPGKLDSIIVALQSKLYEGWNTKPPQSFTTNLEYRVGVAENGEILGFKFANDAALTYVKETPLLDLRYNPTGATPSPVPVAQLLVIFRPDGILEISPWHSPTQNSSP
ncbi:MAG: DUF4335 domain-containing protein [Timaviella obliquedivisa GSE-PSE-MK23-08B]|jgi:hypothetical protein|nr:DUF4335 domain-containing protein [Timaviella obliquedivisa GSE-PSE-MK23-08B]